MYVSPNYKTKKDLTRAVEAGLEVTVFSPGLGQPPTNGECSVEGPHYPEPHRWYARVLIDDGRVVRVK